MRTAAIRMTMLILMTVLQAAVIAKKTSLNWKMKMNSSRMMTMMKMNEKQRTYALLIAANALLHLECERLKTVTKPAVILATFDG